MRLKEIIKRYESADWKMLTLHGKKDIDWLLIELSKARARLKRIKEAIPDDPEYLGGYLYISEDLLRELK